ncbi:MAG: hypothetical protein U1E73_10945 [Planctomycetota bacterium]
MLAPTALRAQFLEGFDSQASANVTVLSEPDTAVMFVDYSNMTIGTTSFTIPEAPRRIPGSAATRGVLIQANLTAALPAAVNILAGTTPIPFSGRYRVSFDCWINVPVPLPGGSTEQLLWAVSSDGLTPNECRHNLATGALGVYGWLAGENGYATEDAVIAEGPLRLDRLGDQIAGQEHFFDDAFDEAILTAVHNTPANHWTRVDIDVDGTTVRVYYNGIQFHNVTAAIPPAGFAMIGYEDPFGSLGTQPDAQWGLFDNFRVQLPSGCNGFGSTVTQGTATAGQIMNGGAEPAVGCPMTLRLRGGPANGLTLLTMGVPSPVTLPIPLANCTLGLEVSIALANVLKTADALGNSTFTIELTPNPAFCGVSFGFQYFWLDNTPCGVATTEGLKLTIGS